MHLASALWIVYGRGYDDVGAIGIAVVLRPSSRDACCNCTMVKKCWSALQIPNLSQSQQTCSQLSHKFQRGPGCEVYWAHYWPQHICCVCLLLSQRPPGSLVLSCCCRSSLFFFCGERSARPCACPSLHHSASLLQRYRRSVG
jgi:hypothetical protein